MRWVAAMNRDLARLGDQLRQTHEFDLVHSHDWLVAKAAARVACSSRSLLKK